MRASGLKVNQVHDGYIVSHGSRDTVCYLNTTASVIFEFCDGSLDAQEIVARVARIFDRGDSAHAEIRSCIDTLIKEELIQSKISK
jgi:hypothetical protein